MENHSILLLRRATELKDTNAVQPQKNKKKKQHRSAVLIILEILLLIVFVVAAYNLIKIYYDYKKGDDFYENAQSQYLSEDKTEPDVSIDLAALQEANPDVIGWIYIPDTPVSYPLLFSGNDNDYLRHTYTHQYSTFGSIFLSQDCTNDLSVQHTLIYGHNTKNGSMFGSLKKYKNLDYANEHQYIYLLMPGKTYKYRVVSAFTVNTGDPVYQLNFEDDSAFRSWLKDIIDSSVIDMQAPVIDGTEKVLTLSTCTSRTQTERFVVNAELIKSWNTSNGV